MWTGAVKKKQGLLASSVVVARPFPMGELGQGEIREVGRPKVLPLGPTLVKCWSFTAAN